MSDELLIEKPRAVATLALDRADKASAPGAALMDALAAALDTTHRDSTCLLVRKGNGRNLRAGSG